METTEKKVKRDSQQSLTQKADSLGLTLVKMATRTEKTSYWIFRTKMLDLGKPESQVLARLANPREVDLFLTAFDAVRTILTSDATDKSE